MALWILVGMVAAVAFGFAWLPVLVVGALAMAALSYALTHDKRIAHIGLGFGLILLNFLMARDLLASLGNEDFPAWAAWIASDELLATTSCVVIVSTMFLGIFGPPKHVPLDMDGVIKKIKDHGHDNRD